MKKITLLLLILPCIISANDTIQMLLESNEISTENFPIVAESTSLSGEDLIKGVNQLHKKEILMAYASIDHDTEAAAHLEQIITNIMTSNEPIHSGVTIIPHLIFDDNRLNGTFRPVGVDDRSLHSLQHKDDIIKVKKFALDQCNQSNQSYQMRIPVFTAPQNLVDILLHVNRPNLSYTLHDGSTFHCIATHQVR